MSLAILNSLTSILNIFQTQSNSIETNEKEKEKFFKDCEQLSLQFEESFILNRRTHLLSTYHQLQGYFQELNENLISSSRDVERDMLDSRNQHFQNIILASTIMLTALLSILYQGELPENAETYYIIIYSITNSLSLIFLLCSIVFSVEMVTLLSKYMHLKAESNSRVLSDAIDNWEKIINQIDPNNDDDNDEKNNKKVNNLLKLNIATSSSEDIELYWQEHESKFNEILRNRILTYTRESNKLNPSYDEFSKNYTSKLSSRVFFFYYIGTILMIISTLIFMWAYFLKRYKFFGAAVSSISILGAALIFCSVLLVYLRFFDINYLKVIMELKKSDDEESFDIDGDKKIV